MPDPGVLVRQLQGDGPTLVGQAPPFQNGWSNFDAAPERQAMFWREGRTVRLSGLVKGGTVGQSFPVFTLPAGARPASVSSGMLIFPCVTTSGTDAFGSLGVWGDGRVVVRAGSNTFVSLDGVAFLAVT